MSEIILNDENFEQEVEKSQVPVLVDFFAEWCGPCQALGPILEELAKKMEGKNVKIAKLDIDQGAKTAEKFEVMSIPTLIIFQNGEEKERMTGLQSIDVLEEKLGKYIK